MRIPREKSLREEALRALFSNKPEKRGGKGKKKKKREYRIGGESAKGGGGGGKNTPVAAGAVATQGLSYYPGKEEKKRKDKEDSQSMCGARKRSDLGLLHCHMPGLKAKAIPRFLRKEGEGGERGNRKA